MSEHTPGSCGCRVASDTDYSRQHPRIIYCPTHAAAPDMAKKYLESIERIVDSIESLAREIREDLSAERAAIAKAKGEA